MPSQVFTENLIDNLFLVGSVATQYIPNPLALSISSTIVVSQAIVADEIYDSEQSVAVAQSIVTGVDTVRTNEDTLTITQSVQGVLIYKNRTSGQTGSAFLDPAAQVAYSNLVPAKTVSWTKGGTTVTLRAPDWGDRDKYEVVRVQEETRGKTLIVFQDSMWPKTETLSLTFSYMSQTDVNTLLDFLITTAGQAVTYIDHFGRTWIGYVLNPDAEVRQTSRSNRIITIDFQGVLQ